MTIDERPRLNIHNKLTELLGSEEADALIASWHDVATKDDLQNQGIVLRADIAEFKAEVRADMAVLRADLRADLHHGSDSTARGSTRCSMSSSSSMCRDDRQVPDSYCDRTTRLGRTRAGRVVVRRDSPSQGYQ